MRFLPPKTSFVINFLTKIIDVGRYDDEDKDNMKPDDNGNIIFSYISLIQTKGHPIKLHLKKSEIKGPYHPPTVGIFVLGPAPEYFYGVMGLFDDDVLGEMINMIINETGGVIRGPHKAYLLDVLKKKYIDKIKNHSIKLLSKSIIGDIVLRSQETEKFTLTERDMLASRLSDITETNKSIMTTSGREEVLTDTLLDIDATKQSAPTEIRMEQKKTRGTTE